MFEEHYHIEIKKFFIGYKMGLTVELIQGEIESQNVEGVDLTKFDKYWTWEGKGMFRSLIPNVWKINEPHDLGFIENFINLYKQIRRRIGEEYEVGISTFIFKISASGYEGMWFLSVEQDEKSIISLFVDTGYGLPVDRRIFPVENPPHVSPVLLPRIVMEEKKE